MDVDSALSQLGRYGRWQLKGYFLASTSCVVMFCWHIVSIVFVGWSPPHHCKVDGDVNISIPREFRNGEWQLSRCLQYKLQDGAPSNSSLFSNQTEACTNGWVYELDSENQRTIVTDFDLVCDKAVLSDSAQSVFVLGTVIGAFVCTPLADTFGRKRVHLVFQWLTGILGSCAALCQDYYVYVVLRFFTGFVQVGAFCAAGIWAVEFFAHDQRTIAGAALPVFWSAGSFCLALFGYFVRDWRHLQLLISLPCFLTISFIWLVPESVPWLAANGREKEAKEILLRAAKMNGVEDTFKIEKDFEMKSLTSQNGHTSNEAVGSGDVVESGVIHRLRTRLCGPSAPKHHHGDEFDYGIKDLCTHPLLRRNTIIIAYEWLMACTIYYGLMMGINTLAGDRYLNFFISAAVEVPAFVSVIFVLLKWGRRPPLIVYSMIAGVALGALIFIPKKTSSGTDLTALIITINTIGKFADSSIFAEICLYVMEVVPTNLRNVSYGIAQGVGRIGALFATYLMYSANYISWMPNLVFGVLGITGSILAFWLPETRHRALPQTVAEMEHWKTEAEEDNKCYNCECFKRRQSP